MYMLSSVCSIYIKDYVFLLLASFSFVVVEEERALATHAGVFRVYSWHCAG